VKHPTGAALDLRREDAGELGISNEVRLMSDVEQRIRERAYQIWLEEGCPEGRELDHWNMATELVAIEDDQQSTLKPIDQNLGPAGKAIEPVEAVRAFPTLTDWGEADIPVRKPKSSVVGLGPRRK
jgi:Protein of unknown function (DUF2934)